MRVRIRLDGRNPRRWHALLVERIARAHPCAAECAVEIDAAPGPGELPENAALLFMLERQLHGLAPRRESAPVAPAALGAPASGREAPDLIVDLCGDVGENGRDGVAQAPGAPVWRLTFDGLAGEAALLAALLAGHAPVAALSEGGRVIASGRVGTEARGLMVASFEDGLARAVTLIAAALSGARPILADGRPPQIGADGLGAGALASRALRMAARAIARRMYRLCCRTPHWRVGWRELDGPDLIDLRAHPATGWRDLPDDGRRFYADPFPVDHEGRTVLFVEEWQHSRGKAVISAVAFDAGGPAGAPVPVLDEPHHLSYPFVFAADGARWMIPESCASGTVDLYRATAFPGGWVKEATLMSGIVASDVTLLEHGGRWWLFATIRDADVVRPGGIVGGGSYSDALHLWSARDFRGPWAPHAQNPVLIDIASARPAGRIAARGGKLIRPAQDGRLGYGAALALARIDRLDDEGYAQTVETVLTAGPLWPGGRLHTLNRSARHEFIDGSGRAPRWKR